MAIDEKGGSEVASGLTDSELRDLLVRCSAVLLALSLEETGIGHGPEHVTEREIKNLHCAVNLACARLGEPAPPSAKELFTEPAWLTEARTWLADFRRAVEAAGLEWVAPELAVESWDQYGLHHSFAWPRGSGQPRLEAEFIDTPGLFSNDYALLTDIPACVEVYRRRFAAREGGKP